MKETTGYILEHWDGDYEHREWWAVDTYDGETGRVHRLYVGDGETACKMAAERASGAGLVDFEGNPAEPGEFGAAPFYRATLISAKSARDYFLCLAMGDMAPRHANELIPVAQAAEELGITRQSAYELVRRGVVPSEECDGMRVGRYSVALRMAAKPERKASRQRRTVRLAEHEHYSFGDGETLDRDEVTVEPFGKAIVDGKLRTVWADVEDDSLWYILEGGVLWKHRGEVL